MRTLKDKVKYLLDTYEETRNSDMYLYTMYLHDFHRDECIVVNGKQHVTLDTILRAPNFESIIRIRQKFQESGFYKPTKEEVKLKRKEKEKNVRRTINTRDFDYYL